MSDLPNYTLPRRLITALAWAALVGRRRSVADDARWAVGTLDPPLQILGAEHIPARGPCLVLCNHYSRPGCGAWWTALSISAAIAAHRAPDAHQEVRWVMTAGWTFHEVGAGSSRPGTGLSRPNWKRRFLTPLTRWAFARAARVYDFIPMPPMPPDPDEVEARAQAVLRTVRLARRIAPQGGMIGLAPEGRDVPGAFGQLPPGAGAFVALLVQAGLPVLPVGVGERRQSDLTPSQRRATRGAGGLYVSFGPLFEPSIPPERTLRDRVVGRQVISAIARQLS